MLEWIHNIDAQILLFIQQYLRNDLFTLLWKEITFLGDGGWFWIVLGLLFLFPKKTRKAGVTALLALTIGAVVTNLCLKDLVARIRPYDSVEGLVPLVARLKDYSFHQDIPVHLLPVQVYIIKPFLENGEKQPWFWQF